MKDGKHRIVLPERHYNLVRRYMVVFELPSARAAVLKMLEVAIEATGKERLLIEEFEELEGSSSEQRRDKVLV